LSPHPPISPSPHPLSPHPGFRNRHGFG
jgi:hypothetical protein